MIRRPTVVYILILFVLAGVWYYISNREEPAVDATATPEAIVEEPQYLFTVNDGLATNIRILSKTGEVVEVARNADDAWTVMMPIEGLADQASAEAAASQVSGMRILDSIKDIDLDLVGVNDPQYILNITFNTGLERTIKVGVVTPTESGYYIQDASGGDVMIVSKSSLDALLGMLFLPPYLETPTPSPVPSSTPEATTTPDGTATPSS